MALAYLGTSDFAATVLRRLVADGEAPAIVITPPDRKQGRGRRLQPPPVAVLATELELPLHQTEDINAPASADALAGADVDLAMVCAFGQLIGAAALEQTLMLNVHPSLLPRWRGAAPIERAMMAGDATTGVAIIQLVEALDAGPIAISEEVAIAPDERFDDLAARLAQLGGELAVRAIRSQRDGALSFVDQDESSVTYAHKIDASDRRLDPVQPAASLERVIRALTPHIGAYLELDGGERLAVRRAEAVEDQVPANTLMATAGALLLGCADGALRILAVQPAGKREMPVADYLRGHPAPKLGS